MEVIMACLWIGFVSAPSGSPDLIGYHYNVYGRKDPVKGDNLNC